MYVFTAVGSVGGTSMGAEPRFELGPVVQQASVPPTEPRCIPFLYLLHFHILYCTLNIDRPLRNIIIYKYMKTIVTY
jgi:hypothetical protein